MRLLKPKHARLPGGAFRTILLAAFLHGESGVTTFAIQPAPVAGFLENYCFDCHDEDVQKGELDLTALPYSFTAKADFQRWVQLFDLVSKQEMPPKKKSQPSASERDAFLEHVASGLRTAGAHAERDGRAELRRLSRVEYANSLKDLLALPHLDFADMLPPDGLEGHHRKSAAALDFSHVTVSKYLEVADHALQQALAPRREGQKPRIIRSELESVQGVRDTVQTLFVQLKQGTAIPLNGKRIDTTTTSIRGNFQKRDPGKFTDEPPYFDGVATFVNNKFNHVTTMKAFKVVQSGTYKIRVHGWGLLNDHGRLRPSDRVETVAFYTAEGKVLGRCDLKPNEPNTGECTVWLEAGEPIEYLAISTPNRIIKIAKHYGERYKHFRSHGIAIQWFELEGPLDPWPPESHRRLLGDLPLVAAEPQPNGVAYKVQTEDPQGDARKLLRDFSTRALRRPLRADDLDVPFATTKNRLAAGDSFIDSLLAGYRAILTSPAFMLRAEKPGPLDAWAVATRLSFFLENSPPDEALRAAATTGELLTDEGLRAHTERLLDGPKLDRFVAHFTDYWLNVRNINLTEPDENLYPEYSGLVSESMVAETRAYFAELIRRNLGAMHVVDSDFLMINQRLAELYDIPGVSGSRIQKVSLPADSVRGGFITQGSILKLTANGTTTSPVVRGTYLLEHLLGDPPPPPPGSVPAIEPDVTGAKTIREQLVKHREDAACASCHAKIDPPGFALEGFDVMGQYRDRYRVAAERGKGIKQKFNGAPALFKHGGKVESGGELPNGASFADINSFRNSLASYESKIAHNLLEHLVLYATGAPLGFADRPVAEDILHRLETDGYGLRSMIHAVVQSELFRHK